MSRKRNRGEARVTLSQVPEAIPEDVVAEGSGPVQAICHVGIDAIGADVPAEPDTLDAVARRRAKRKKREDIETEAPGDLAASPEAEPAAEADAKPKSRRKRTPLVADVETASDTPGGDAIEAVADDPAADADVIETAADGADGDADGAVTGDAIEASADPDADAIDVATEDAGDATEETADPDADGAIAAQPSDDATAVLPTSAADLPPEQLKQLVEALVFASDKPMTLIRLRQLTRISDVKKLETTLSELAADYADRGLVLQQVSGGYQFRTRTEWSGWVQQLIAGRPVRLTRAQLETLAIIAYRQPITRPEIDDIRGVDSSATLKLLIDRQLIRILGKKEEVGRPMLYGTTKEFLDFFSLGDLRELPTLREYSELTDESRQVISDRLGPADDEGDGNEGQGSPDGGPIGGDGGAGDPSLSAAPETAADLIAAYVAELDHAAQRAGEPVGEVLFDAMAQVSDAMSAAPETAEDAMPVDAMFVDAMSVDAMSVDAMSAEDAMSVDAMSVDVMSEDAMSVDAMSVDVISVDVISVDDALGLSEAEVEDSVPLALETVDSGSLADLDPFAAVAEGSGPTEAREARESPELASPDRTVEDISPSSDPSLLAADMAESAGIPASPGADPPQE